jgi:hypothetical protein
MYGELSKKNIFYDLKSGGKTLFLSSSSKLRPLNIRHVSNLVSKLITEKTVGIVNVANPNIIEISEILELDNKQYDHKNERFINESNICVDKFNKDFQFNESKKELIEDIWRYINF